ncbi:MAG TPA: ATP-dependent helicase C-terminal domain-containing protein, partial [Anaeromyxobacteraceae bacterium]
MQPLPIDPRIPEVVAALRRAPSLVVEAPPGAGKTTRLPRALLEGGVAGEGEVLVLEPRRLAARLAARRVAEELGERPGETVGWQVRFEDVSGPRTRLRFLTEALLSRRLLDAPRLPGVGAVVLDEVHERHLQGDLALALLRRLQRGPRPDLRLVAMSATLDAGPLARFLGAEVIRAEGRSHPVAVEHLSPEAARREERLERRVAAAVRRLAAETDGDVLVFLPGAAEIRRCREALAPLAGRAGLAVLPLHGDLPAEEQDRAVRPSDRRKVVLSTNVAESSVTIPGVAAVVDGGLARVASHSPWSGLPRLELRKISRASAAQRAGRAGRTRPGVCIRLYTRADHDARPERDAPEIARGDLAEPLLLLAAAGVEGLEWLEPPPPAAAEAARTLLRRLGAVDAAGAATELGRRMAGLPLHPRLARLALEAAARGAPRQGALVAALAGERDLRERWDRDPRTAPPTGPSDLLELAALFEEAARVRFAPERLRALGLVPGAVQAVERARRQIEREVRRATARAPLPLTPALPVEGATPSPPAPAGAGERGSEPGTSPAEEDAVLLATLAAFPDRVARRRAPGSDEVLLAGGGSARLAPECVVREAEVLVAVDAEERRGDRGRPGGAAVRLASAASPEMLLELFPGSLRYEEQLSWNEAAERVDAAERLLYDDLALETARAARLDPERAAELLASQALARGPAAFAPEGEVERLLARVAFAGLHAPGALPALGEEDARQALRRLCRGRRSFAELREADLPAAVLALLPPHGRSLVERLAPDRVALPGGRSVRVHYQGGGKPPWIGSRLQDFFGMVQGPAVAGGKVPLVLHLLAPSQRPVQVTTDLAGFWERHYPALRRELMRRYPRHAWPEDPRTAAPPGR